MIRDRKINLMIMHHLKDLGYDGHVVLTAANDEEADAYEKAGTHLVLRPYRHIAKHASDAITNAMQ